MSDYQTYCKPSLARALESVGLARVFHRAQGQFLYDYNDNQQEREVLDLLGGYGAVILGHNHPVVLETLRQQIKQGTAFHNQFSLRSGAAELAATLNPLLRQETGWQENFICAFASTGAESVEIALKHSEIVRGRKLDELQQTLTRANEKVEATKGIEDSEWLIDECVRLEHPQLKAASYKRKLDFIKDWNDHKLNEAPLFIALKRAFHGKLTSSIQLTHGEMYRNSLRRMGLKSRFITPLELNSERIERLKSDEQAHVLELRVRQGKVLVRKHEVPFVAALLVEPVQGEGGVHCLDEQDARALHESASRLGCPLIADEVQSGCGRCGSVLAGSQIGLRPDYVVLSKGLGGGVSKIGVVAIRESQYADGFDLLQSSTFGEDDWSARVATTFIKYLTKDDKAVLADVRGKGELLSAALQGIHKRYPDIVLQVRGKGLLYGIEFKDQSDALSVLIRTTAYQGVLGYLIAGYLLAHHNIRVAPPASSGNVVRIEPSIQLSETNIQQLVTALESVCLALRFQDAGYILAHLLEGYTPDMVAQPQDYRDWYAALGLTKPRGEADYKVAFVNHLISSEWLRDVDQSLAHLSAEQTVQLLDRLSIDRRVAPFAPVRVFSRQGHSVDFTLYPINATSQQISEMLERNQLDEIRAAVDERLAAARDDGCTLAGLGMFTSIVTNNGKAVRTPGIKLTSGNALTVAMAAQAIQRAIAEQKRTISCAAVIGAAGNIGSVYSTLIAEFCPSIILAGSGHSGSSKRLRQTAALVYESSLRDLAKNPEPGPGIAGALLPYARQNNWLSEEYLRGDAPGEAIYHWFEEHPSARHPVQVVEEISAIKQADLLVCAANSAEAFVEQEYLKHNVLVCDIAVPHNLADSLLEERPDIHCLRGGIVNTPHGESLDPRARAYLKTGQVYACMAETIVLGLENFQDHYSYGNINKAQVKNIMNYSRAHGLSLAETKQTESM